MKKTLFTLLLTVMMLTMSANEIRYFTDGQASRAVSFLNNQRELVIYCGYEDELETYVLVNEIWAERINSVYSELWIYGYDAYTGEEIFMPFDLGCIWLERNGKLYSAAAYLRFHFSGGMPNFAWAMPPYNAYNRPHRPAHYTVTYHYDVHLWGWCPPHYDGHGPCPLHPYYMRQPHHALPHYAHPYTPGHEQPVYTVINYSNNADTRPRPTPTTTRSASTPTRTVSNSSSTQLNNGQQPATGRSATSSGTSRNNSAATSSRSDDKTTTTTTSSRTSTSSTPSRNGSATTTTRTTTPSTPSRNNTSTTSTSSSRNGSATTTTRTTTPSTPSRNNTSTTSTSSSRNSSATTNATRTSTPTSTSSSRNSTSTTSTSSSRNSSSATTTTTTRTSTPASNSSSRNSSTTATSSSRNASNSTRR